MAFSRYSSLYSMGGALLAAALAWPPAACAAPSGTPRAGADPAPQERVLDVTLVSPGTAARPEAARQPGRPPALAPGAAIAIVVLSFNLAGDGLHDALDPRLSGSF